MLTLSQFRDLFPEFRGVDSDLLTAKLAAAAVRLSVAVFDETINEAHGWKTAHLVASHPWGSTARLDLKNAGAKDETVYSAALKRLIDERGAGRGAI